MDVNFWGVLIRSLREEQSISQRTLSAETGVNRSTLRKIETGETPGDMAIMETLLAYLGYELEAIQKGTFPERYRVENTLALNTERRSRLAAARILTLQLS